MTTETTPTPKPSHTKSSPERPYQEALTEAHKTDGKDGETYIEFIERMAFRAVCIPDH